MVYPLTTNACIISSAVALTGGKKVNTTKNNKIAITNIANFGVPIQQSSLYIVFISSAHHLRTKD